MPSPAAYVPSSRHTQRLLRVPRRYRHLEAADDGHLADYLTDQDEIADHFERLQMERMP